MDKKTLTMKPEDIDNGACCAICGKDFIKENNFPATETTLEFDAPASYWHFYPVACENCWTPDCGYDKQEKGVEIL